jgi:hypothetical protein
MLKRWAIATTLWLLTALRNASRTPTDDILINILPLASPLPPRTTASMGHRLYIATRMVNGLALSRKIFWSRQRDDSVTQEEDSRLFEVCDS